MDVENTFRQVPVGPDDAAAFGHVLSCCACATFWLKWLFPATLAEGGVRLAPRRLLAPQLCEGEILHFEPCLAFDIGQEKTFGPCFSFAGGEVLYLGTSSK